MLPSFVNCSPCCDLRQGKARLGHSCEVEILFCTDFSLSEYSLDALPRLTPSISLIINSDTFNWLQFRPDGLASAPILHNRIFMFMFLTARCLIAYSLKTGVVKISQQWAEPHKVTRQSSREEFENSVDFNHVLWSMIWIIVQVWE